MNKSDTQENNPELKNKIIDAARELFVKKGYYHTNMPDIVKSAKVSIGAVYHYFKGKESLAKEIHDYSVQLLEENFQNKILILNTARERVHTFIKMMFEWTENDPVLVEYLLFARPQDIFNEKTSICSSEGFILVMDIIKYGQQNSEIKEGDPYPYYTILSGSVSRYIELYLEKKLTLPITDYIETAYEITWNAIKKE
jgi:hypothetical protein